MLARFSGFTLVTCVALLTLSGCTGASDDAPSSPDVLASSAGATPSDGADTEPAAAQATLRAPADAVTVLAQKDATELALAASASFFDTAPIAVLAADNDAEVLRAASAAVALGAPLLLVGADEGPVHAEISRLEVETVLTFGAVFDGEADGKKDTPDTANAEPTGNAGADGDLTWLAAPTENAGLEELLGLPTADALEAVDNKHIRAVRGLTRGTFTPVKVEGAPGDTENEPGVEPTGSADESEESAPTSPAALPATALPDPLATVLTLTTNSSASVAAVATATAAGAQVAPIPGGDPRKTSKTVAAIADADYEHVIGIGSAFANEQTLTWRIETAATGVELPGTGQLVFPGKRYIALYGTPSTTVLGVLGEQDVPDTIKRAAKHAKKYEKHSDDVVVPALEIIATVASSSAGPDGNYSNELSPQSLRPLIDAAHDAGQYVLLDLQPGRSSFLEQAKLYQELLELPHVGLALDPEWNLGPDEVHLKKIGSVSAKEVNAVVTWLADFTQRRALPQKMLVLHQFQPRMIDTVDKVDLSRSEIAVLIHADGQGGQPAKQGTWKTLHAHAPDMQWWGWKNFYDEDVPMLTPKQTSQVKPFPNFISYQ